MSLHVGMDGVALRKQLYSLHVAGVQDGRG